MFNEIMYTPYSQIRFAMGDSEMKVSSPWLALDVAVEADKKPGLTALLNRLALSNPMLSDEQMQEFLGFFAHFPLMHVLPRSLKDEKISAYESQGTDILTAKGPLQFLQAINPFEDLDVKQCFAYFPHAWEWDANDIAAASAIPGTTLFDPYSAYTALRARRLQYQIDQAGVAHTLLERVRALQETNPDAFFDIMATILAQQFYVTRECCACLDPAIAHHGMLSDEIRAYKDEEINHDRLILKSIRELTDAPTESFFFAPEVRMEIEVIKYAATSCALGFSALVSIMEGTVYPNSDPVGDILLASSKPSAHIGVEAHFQINRRGNHTAIPESFVRRIPPVTRQTIDIATRLAEVTIRLDTGLARTMMQRLPAAS